MKMNRKIQWIVCVFLMLLSGCTQHNGNFKEGNVNLNSFFVDINKNINQKKFKMALLNDKAITKAQIEQLYKLDMNKIDDCMVKSALISAQLSEIAIFKIEEKQEQIVKDAIDYRIQRLREKWGSYREDASHILHNAEQGRIGQYYYLVLGDDSKKIVNFMKNGV